MNLLRNSIGFFFKAKVICPINRFEFETEWCLLFFLFIFCSVLLLFKIFCCCCCSGENSGEILSLTIIFKYNHILEVLQ